MLDFKDLKKFVHLAPEFSEKLNRDIERAIDLYDNYRSYVVRLVQRKGDDAYKSAETYFDIVDDVRYESYPRDFENKIVQILGDMCYEYCGNDKILKALDERRIK